MVLPHEVDPSATGFFERGCGVVTCFRPSGDSDLEAFNGEAWAPYVPSRQSEPLICAVLRL